jgi:hypothetical protein
MVSVKYVLLAAGSLSQVYAQGGFIMNQGSRMAVDFFVSGRSDNVPEARASSEAGHVASVVVNHPAFQKVVNDAVAAFPGGIDKAKIKQLVQEADKAFTQFSNDQAYKPLTSYVKSVGKDFDTSKLVAMAKSHAQPAMSRYSSEVNNFFADPDGKAIGSTISSMGHHIASDYGYEQLWNKEMKDFPPKSKK